jgi:CheY-like chemotaxis protein
MMDDAGTQSAHRKRLLLVEDVDTMRFYVRLILEQQGFEVAEAGTLQETRQQLRAGYRPTSVLLDLELPDGHGLDLIDDLPPGVPVVAFSADESSETVLRCRRNGCTAVLGKSKRLGKLGQFMSDIESAAVPASRAVVQEPELARRYRDFLGETLIELQQAGELYDLDKMSQIAHRLCGTAVHFGYLGISASARGLKESIDAGHLYGIEAALDDLLQQFLQARERGRSS